MNKILCSIIEEKGLWHIQLEQQAPTGLLKTYCGKECLWDAMIDMKDAHDRTYTVCQECGVRSGIFPLPKEPDSEVGMNLPKVEDKQFQEGRRYLCFIKGRCAVYLFTNRFARGLSGCFYIESPIEGRDWQTHASGTIIAEMDEVYGPIPEKNNGE